MRPLNIALVIRPKKNLMRRDDRSIGLFSYSVPQFRWKHIAPRDNFSLSRPNLADYDAIVVEDGAFGQFIGTGGPPIIGIFWDTNWTERHYQRRLKQAGQCDLIFIGQDPLGRFKVGDKPVKRLSYCVNDKVFRDYKLPKDVDICFHANLKHSPNRVELHEFLTGWAKVNERVYRGRPVMGLEDYARAFNRSRISINLSRVPQNRPHRVFDVMASYSCLLTSPLPKISGERRQAGKHYLEWNDYDELTLLITSLIDSGEWRKFAEDGFRLVEEYYTWAARAEELRQKINKALGI